jgi:transposase
MEYSADGNAYKAKDSFKEFRKTIRPGMKWNWMVDVVTHELQKFYEAMRDATAVLRGLCRRQRADRDRDAHTYQAPLRHRGGHPRHAARSAARNPSAAFKACDRSLKPWFEASLAKVPKGGKLAEALGYGLNHWHGLCRYFDDGRIEIDSNTVERSIRGLALTRKNALFAGHDRGAAGWAMIASLLET